MQSVFKGKTYSQLQVIFQGIEGKIRAGGPNLDMGYWESLLQQLRAHMARARSVLGPGRLGGPPRPAGQPLLSNLRELPRPAPPHPGWASSSWATFLPALRSGRPCSRGQLHHRKAQGRLSLPPAASTLCVQILGMLGSAA